MSEGSYSVEAALLMPVIICTVLAVILYGFYIRDIVFMETAGRAVLEKYDNKAVILTETAGHSFDDSELRQAFEEGLLYSKIRYFYISEKKREISLCYGINTNILGLNFKKKGLITKTLTESAPEKLQCWRSWIEEAKELLLE